MIKPTIGRVVWYWPNGRQPDGAQPYAASVAYVQSDTRVNLGWLDHDGFSLFAKDVYLQQEGNPEPAPKVPYAEWMPYQIGQAGIRPMPAPTMPEPQPMAYDVPAVLTEGRT